MIRNEKSKHYKYILILINVKSTHIYYIILSVISTRTPRPSHPQASSHGSHGLQLTGDRPCRPEADGAVCSERQPPEVDQFLMGRSGGGGGGGVGVHQVAPDNPDWKL